jgi:RNA polymerase sigma factor (sigma-70 family)
VTPPADSHPLVNDEALRRRLVALARHWLAHGDEAEDLVQDTWLRTAQGRLPPDASGREAWLVTVLRHLCIDAWRRRQRHHALLEPAGEGDAPSADSEAPQALAEQAQRVEQALRHVVRTLPAAQAAAVLLVEVFDFTHAELARLTGRSEAASRQQLHRLLQRLRQPVTPARPDDEDADCLLALCQWALAQRDPAGLVAVLRVASPQAMAVSAQPARDEGADPAPAPATRLVQFGRFLALQVRTPGGLVACLPLGEAVTETV